MLNMDIDSLSYMSFSSTRIWNVHKWSLTIDCSMRWSEYLFVDVFSPLLGACLGNYTSYFDLHLIHGGFGDYTVFYIVFIQKKVWYDFQRDNSPQ